MGIGNGTGVLGLKWVSRQLLGGGLARGRAEGSGAAPRALCPSRGSQGCPGRWQELGQEAP